MSTPETLGAEAASIKSAQGKVWCTYCGKRFTRKEHLERHLPTHTNVKPYRCGACTLGFTRRDLLQRHYTTYHEPRDSTEPPAGGMPTIAGRNQISCLTCANAKTGCDKKVPCTRCAEKNLPCEPRYARRSSKAAIRAAQAANAPPQLSQQMHPPSGTSLAVMTGSQPGIKAEVSSSPTAIEMALPGHHDEDGSPARATPQHPVMNLGDFPSPHARVEGAFDDCMSFGASFGLHIPPFHNQPYQSQTPQDPPPQDFWMDFGMHLDAYQHPATVGGPSIAMAPLPDFGNVSPTSELMTASASGSSTRGSIQTSATSRLSAEFDDSSRLVGLATVAPVGDSVADLQAVVVAEAAWNLARCNPLPPANSCPRTALVHLECLEQRSKQEGTWSTLEQYLEQIDWGSSDSTSVVPLTSSTRDKMLAITQSFLHKALEIHRGGLHCHAREGPAGPGQLNFLVLPSSKILEYFLRSYVRSLSAYYPLVTTGRVDPNEMLEDNRASTLLLLLMIAQGAAAMPMAEARYLAAGLTETCRISLFDIVEKDVELSGDPVTLRCALLFIVLGAWSGDKWLMDIAMGQRGMYMSMLKHAGMLEPQTSVIPEFNDSVAIELQWRDRIQRETRNRLVYNYVMLDQELSLFHDTAPLFAITELHSPLPEPEILWMSESSEQWFTMMQSLHGCTANVNPQLLSTSSTTVSLHQLFQDFLQDDFLSRHPSPSPQQLRLILHPLQALVCNLRQMVSCFPDDFDGSPSSGCPMTRRSILCQLEEMQVLMQKWYGLTMDYNRTNPSCSITRCNLVLYHLIYLNTMADFPEIERMARREGFGGMSWELPLWHRKCIFRQHDRAILHCGQVLRLLGLMPKDRRPAWWPVAMYRATMVLWAESLTRIEPNLQAGGGHSKCKRQKLTHVIIDGLEAEDPSLADVAWSSVGEPALRCPDGAVIGLDRPGDILSYAVKHLETCFTSRIGDGIMRKLITLRNNWSGVEAMALSPCGGGGL